MASKPFDYQSPQRSLPPEVFAQFPAHVLYPSRYASQEVDQRVKAVSLAAENRTGFYTHPKKLQDVPIVFAPPRTSQDVPLKFNADILALASPAPAPAKKTVSKALTPADKKRVSSSGMRTKAKGSLAFAQAEIASLSKSASVVVTAKTAMWNHDLDSAFHGLAEAIDQGVKHADVCYLFGEVSRLKGLFEQAEKFLTKALCFKLHSPYAYYSLGLLYLDLKKYAPAIDALKRFLSLVQTSDGCFHLGKAYSLLNNYASAVEALTTAIRLEPKRAAYYLYRGKVYEAQGNAVLAKLDYNQALSVDPKLLVPYYNEYERLKKGGEVAAAAEIKAFMLKMKDAAAYHS